MLAICRYNLVSGRRKQCFCQGSSQPKQAYMLVDEHDGNVLSICVVFERVLHLADWCLCIVWLVST